MAKLIFFDINGTLIARDERTDIPFMVAVEGLLDEKGVMAGINTSARSDQDVFMEILQRKGMTYTENLWNDFLIRYEEQLTLWKTSDVWRANADAVPFVKSLLQTDCNLALITGELKIGATYKLEKLGIWSCFNAGGYGEHGLNRFDIATYAYNEAKDVFKWVSEPEIYVIGDTCLDIKTARHLGAVSISIATGSNTWEELELEKPDYLIREFKELQSLFDVVF